MLHFKESSLLTTFIRRPSIVSLITTSAHQFSSNEGMSTVVYEGKSYVHGASEHPLLFTTIGERIRLAARKFPNREFVLFKHERIRKTYKEVLEDVRNGERPENVENFDMIKG
jgi:hypothetical protein